MIQSSDYRCQIDLIFGMNNVLNEPHKINSLDRLNGLNVDRTGRLQSDHGPERSCPPTSLRTQNPPQNQPRKT